MEPASALIELSSICFACRDVETLLKTFAARMGADLQARAVFVWVASEAEEGLVCRARWAEPGERMAPVSAPVSEGILAQVLEEGEGRRLTSKEIDAQELVHLEEGQRSRVKTALYAPLPGARGVAGVVEVLNRRSGEFTGEDLGFLEAASRLIGQAFAQLEAIDLERRGQLSTMERLTALYDLSRIFNSTLELEQLLPIVAGKIRDILGAQACNLWLTDTAASELYLARQSGEDPTVKENARAPLNEGVLGDVAQQGNPRLVEDPAGEPDLAARREAGGDFQIETIICAPLRKDDEVLGVVELVNKLEGGAFDEDDLFFLASVSEQAGVALHNANLLESERKVHALDALLKISQEITSTLNLDHVLTTVVHQAATVVPFDRCAIGFYDRNRFILGAVSGEGAVSKSREMDELREMMEWVAEQPQPVAADQYDDGWRVTPEEGRVQLVARLEARDYSGFYALPLSDEQGTLGVLALMSSDAAFLTQNNRETLSILANQTTVAIRNAQLYQQVPLANLLQPLAQRKQRIMAAVPFSRWVDIGWKLAAAAVVLVVVPWPMRIGANATVVPAERRVVSAAVGGVIRRVLVHEGEPVTQGQPLAQLDDGQYRVQLEQAQTSLALARRELSDAEFRRDIAAAGQARLRAQIYEAQVGLETEHVSEAELLAPIAGVVVTPKVEEKAGTMLNAGDRFCEIVEQDRMAAEMNVPETQMGLIQPGTKMALKLNAYPLSTFTGTVERIGAQTVAEEGEQFFVVRGVFANPDGRARDGMAGKGHIQAAGGWWHTGWYPVGYVMFRSFFNWIWQKAWAWLP
jgi:RND family efflux transporter MFP subunit